MSKNRQSFCLMFNLFLEGVPKNTNLQYYNEIVGRLERDGINIKHFILIASKKNIISRLNARDNSTEWAYMQVDRCDKAFKDDYLKGQKIDTNNKNVAEVCNNLIKIIYG